MAKRGRPPYPDILTPREWEVLACIRDGLSNDAIAQRLGISIDGVKYHVSEILGKLGLENRSEAARWRREEARPWWAVAAGPLLFWRRASAGWLSGAITGGLIVAGAAGVVALVLVITSMGGGQSGAPLALPAGDRLAYVGTDGNLWLLEDGVAGRLTEDSRVSSLSWSPDGRWLIFLRSPARVGGTFEKLPPIDLWLANAETGELRVVADGPGTLNGFTGQARWSPDSSRIAFLASTGSDPSNLWIAGVSGGDPRQLVPPPFAVADFDWSPEGRRIAFSRSEDVTYPEPPVQPSPETIGFPAGNGVYVVDADGGEPEPVVLRDEIQLAYEAGELRERGELFLSKLGVTGVSGLQWSPDDEYIAFQAPVLSTAASADGEALFTVPAAGGAPVYHGVMLRSKALLDWFPEGHRFMFTLGQGREVSLDKRIAVAEAGVAGAEVVAEDGRRSDASPALSPDGERIAFQASMNESQNRLDIGKVEGPLEGIWIADAGGSSARQLTSDPAYLDFLPGWSADGTSIVFVRTDGGQFVNEGGTAEPEAHAEVWIVHADGGEPRPLIKDLVRLGSYYGLFGWEGALAWHRGE